jgi:hypothetical protein
MNTEIKIENASDIGFKFYDGTPAKDGYYLVELDQPGLVDEKPFDVDYCRAKSPSDGGGREFMTWGPHNVRRWAHLPSIDGEKIAQQYAIKLAKSAEIERENERLNTYNRQAENAATQHKIENARLRDALQNLAAQCKSGDCITAWWRAAVDQAESALLPNVKAQR